MTQSDASARDRTTRQKIEERLLRDSEANEAVHALGTCLLMRTATTARWKAPPASNSPACPLPRPSVAGYAQSSCISKHLLRTRQGRLPTAMRSMGCAERESARYFIAPQRRALDLVCRTPLHLLDRPKRGKARQRPCTHEHCEELGEGAAEWRHWISRLDSSACSLINFLCVWTLFTSFTSKRWRRLSTVHQEQVPEFR